MTMSLSFAVTPAPSNVFVQCCWKTCGDDLVSLFIRRAAVPLACILFLDSPRFLLRG